jgi:hypothetical protein
MKDGNDPTGLTVRRVTAPRGVHRGRCCRHPRPWPRRTSLPPTQQTSPKLPTKIPPNFQQNRRRSSGSSGKVLASLRTIRNTRPDPIKDQLLPPRVFRSTLITRQVQRLALIADMCVFVCFSMFYVCFVCGFLCVFVGLVCVYCVVLICVITCCPYLLFLCMFLCVLMCVLICVLMCVLV